MRRSTRCQCYKIADGLELDSSFDGDIMSACRRHDYVKNCASGEILVCRPSGSGALGDHQRDDIARGLVGQMGGTRDWHCLDLEPVSCDSSDDCGGRTGGFDRVASEEVVPTIIA